MNLEIQILFQNAIEHIKRKELGRAKELLSKANGLSPNNPDVLRYLSVVSALKFDYEEAILLINQVIDIAPNYGIAYSNKGNLLKELGRYSEAFDCFDKAIDLAPDYPEVYNNKANTLQDLYRCAEAVPLYDKAISLFPGYAEALSNRGNALEQLGRHDEALESYQLAINANPQYADAYWNMAGSLLHNGDFERGWQNYESRWYTNNPLSRQHSSIPQLESLEDVAGKKILIWTEQGQGDTIQFCRYIKLLAQHKVDITMEITKSLMELLKPLEIFCTLKVKVNSEIEHFDFQLPLLSLPLLFKTTVDTIPSEIPYLFSEPFKKTFFSNQLPNNKNLKVGVVWNGGFRQNCQWLWLVNKRRNIELEQIAYLQDIANVDFYSLQKGDPAESELIAKKDLVWPDIKIFSDQLLDFSDTAALIDNLDLVISVDTSTAHLAGALGKPVWIMNRHDSCWRWLRGKKESPWYPSARIYQQIKPGEWQDVINQVKEDLLRLSESPRN